MPGPSKYIPSEDPSLPKQRTVMIAAEDPAYVEELTDLLCGSIPKLHYVMVADGEDGIRTIHEESVELVIAEAQLRGMTGVEFLRKVRTKAPHVKRILVVPPSDLAAPIPGLKEAGVTVVLSRPLVPAKVVAAVLEALGEANVEFQASEPPPKGGIRMDAVQDVAQDAASGRVPRLPGRRAWASGFTFDESGAAAAAHLLDPTTEGEMPRPAFGAPPFMATWSPNMIGQ